MQTLIEHGTHHRRPLQIQMNHIEEAIIAERHIEQINHFKVVSLLEQVNGLSKMIQHIRRIVAADNRRLWKHHADRLCSVVETQFDVIAEDFNILFDGVGMKSFIATFKCVSVTEQRARGNITVDFAFSLHKIQIGVLFGAGTPNSSDAVIDQIEKNFIVLDLRRHILERQQKLEIARMNAERFLNIITKDVRDEPDQNKLYEIIMMGGATIDIQKHVEQSDILDGGLDCCSPDLLLSLQLFDRDRDHTPYN